MKIEEILADIETEVGRMSMALYAGEYTACDLKIELKTLQDLMGELDDLRSSNEDWLDNCGKDTRKSQRIEEQTGEMDDAACRLGEAEYYLRALVAKPKDKRLPGEITSQLDAACDHLTRAMEV